MATMKIVLIIVTTACFVAFVLALIQADKKDVNTYAGLTITSFILLMAVLILDLGSEAVKSQEPPKAKVSEKKAEVETNPLFKAMEMDIPFPIFSKQ